MTEHDKTTEIVQIISQISVLKKKVKNANDELDGLIEKRDMLNETFNKIREEISELKKERENLNEEVQTLKHQRNEAQFKIKDHIKAIKETKEKMVELKKRKPRENQGVLQTEFDNIEWKIQTTPIDMQEEKRLMDRVKKLERQLNVYKKIDEYFKEISRLHEELKTFETNANTNHHKLIDIAKRSQEVHAKIIAKVAESKDVKSKADSLHRAYIQALKQLKLVKDEINSLIGKKQKLQIALREEEEKKKKTTEQALKKKLGSHAKEKLQRGEKLNWDEFKLLVIDDSKERQAQD